MIKIEKKIHIKRMRLSEVPSPPKFLLDFRQPMKNQRWEIFERWRGIWESRGKCLAF